MPERGVGGGRKKVLEGIMVTLKTLMKTINQKTQKCSLLQAQEI